MAELDSWQEQRVFVQDNRRRIAIFIIRTHNRNVDRSVPIFHKLQEGIGSSTVQRTS